ncbi:36.4 kDa proline-rich protein-like [Zingiber officinale]|uniref:36.4 kDa proline-rich protein-like n=1 Tax=Zingiber officinale TaxID=94328 RepID=UPI001C4C76AA|nr:36.4 kDa proline-rich protein-like [Zingiber officinale]
MEATKSQALFVASMLLVSFFLLLLLLLPPLAYACADCPPSSKSKSPVVGKPPVIPPPITVPPPITDLPPVINPPPVGGSTLSPTPPPVMNPPPASFPVDRFKVWARVDLFGGRVHIEVGDPAANQFSQMPQGIVDPEDAVCLCAAIKLKLLSLNVYLALQLPLA